MTTSANSPTRSSPASSSDQEAQQAVERLAAKSPEGTPAHPGAGPNAIAALLIVAIVVMTAAGLLVGFLWSPLAGLILGGIALVALLVSPAVWSAVLRAKERQEVVHE